MSVFCSKAYNVAIDVSLKPRPAPRVRGQMKKISMRAGKGAEKHNGKRHIS